LIIEAGETVSYNSTVYVPAVAAGIVKVIRDVIALLLLLKQPLQHRFFNSKVKLITHQQSAFYLVKL
jgi:hypothetical protein